MESQRARGGDAGASETLRGSAQIGDWTRDSTSAVDLACSRLCLSSYTDAWRASLFEQAETTSVSPQGGLLELSGAVLKRSHPILLTNLHTNEELACRVARVIKTETGKTLVGLEFAALTEFLVGGFQPAPASASLTRPSNARSFVLL